MTRHHSPRARVLRAWALAAAALASAAAGAQPATASGATAAPGATTAPGASGATDARPSAGAVPGLPADAGRPRIGLALSGGGARGAAHIGVLKVLEDLRVPVDCIAGTSMGAIVGGVYAAGTSATAMEHIVNATDWRAVFDDAPPRTEVAVRRKAEDYRGLADPEFGVGVDGLRLPKGVIAGVALESFLRRLTQPAQEVSDFSRLPIPFSAVASDIVAGEQVVLSRGNLSRAMRASMAIPGAVSPIEIDGRLLVDGGVTNNLPIDVARATCAADVVIAVNIQTPLMKREDITSAVGVLGQLVNFLGKVTVDRQIATLGERDVLISPDLGDISAASFERSPDAVRIGEAAARAVAPRLRRYSLPADAYAELRLRRISPPVGLGAVEAVRFEGLERTNEEVLRALVRARPGELLSEEDLGRDLRRVYGRGDFESVDYRILTVDGARTLMFGVREKDSGPGYLRFGLGFATDFHGESQFSLRAAYRRSWLNRLGAELLLDAQVGRRNAVLAEFYQPLVEAGRWFVAPYLSFDETRRSLYALDRRVAELRGLDARAGLDLGAVFGTVAEVRFGAVGRRLRSSTAVGLTLIPDENESARGLRARVFVDQLDRPIFARDGYALWIDATAWQRNQETGRGAYRRLEARAEVATSRGPHTWNLTLQGGSRLGTDLPVFDAFPLGGPFALSGYPVGRFLTEGYGYARMQYYRRVYGLPNPLGTGVYAGASFELARLSTRSIGGSRPDDAITSGAIFVGADTFLGPLYLVLGFGENGNRAVYLFVGVR